MIEVPSRSQALSAIGLRSHSGAKRNRKAADPPGTRRQRMENTEQKDGFEKSVWATRLASADRREIDRPLLRQTTPNQFLRIGPCR